VFRTTDRDALNRGTPYNQDLRIVLPAGACGTSISSASPSSTRRGRVVRLCGTLIDINARKLVERHLQTQNEELKKINEDSDRFVYSAGHDLRAPLMSVLGLINIAQLDDKAPRRMSTWN
jgi:signal transduction histidine kinase